MAMTGVFATYQNLYFLPLVFTFSIGPLFYFFVRSRINSTFRISRKDLVHFILPVVQFLFYLVISVQSTETKSQIWRDLIAPYIQYIEEVLVILLGVGYLIYCIILIDKSIPKSHLNLAVNKWLRKFAFSLLILLIISSLYDVADWILWGFYQFNLFNTPWVDFPLKMIYAIISLIIGYNAYIYQNQSLITKPLYQNSDWEKLQVNIADLLGNKKVYLDPELNLGSFAKMLNAPKNSVSKYFSTSGESFRGVINRYRVDYFVSLLEKKEYQNMSLLGLAFESGFNSKASFNRIFKEQKGTTPSSYIRSLKSDEIS